MSGSPHIRVATANEPEDIQRFLLLAAEGQLVIARADATPLTTAVPASDGGAARVVTRLEHLAKWHLFKGLRNPTLAIAGQVEIEVVPAERGQEPPRPGERERLLPDATGNFRLRYRKAGTGSGSSGTRDAWGAWLDRSLPSCSIEACPPPRGPGDRIEFDVRSSLGMVVIGTDSHKRTHTVVVVDDVGRRLDVKTSAPTATATWSWCVGRPSTRLPGAPMRRRGQGSGVARPRSGRRALTTSPFGSRCCGWSRVRGWR
jgi:hypothetical protein